MLVILSEFECLEKLNVRGIYPDEYFTDIYSFKERCIAFQHATVVLITAGLSRFNKQRVIELSKLLKSQSDDKNYNSIDNFILLSDIQFRLPEYYRYSSDFSTFDKYNNAKIVEQDMNILDTLRRMSSDKKEPSFVRLHPLDTENYSCEEAFNEAMLSKTEVEIYNKIKRPHVKDMIVSS